VPDDQRPAPPRIKDEFWRPECDETAQREVRQAAVLPGGRPWSLCDRFNETPSAWWRNTATMCLSLLYTLLIDDQPALAPNPQRLRPLVEGNDLAGIDEAMEPLDRAALALLADWRATQPRLVVLVDRARRPDNPALEPLWLFGELRTKEFDYRWEEAWRSWRGLLHDVPGADDIRRQNQLEHHHARLWLDNLLISRHGGIPIGEEVRISYDRRGLVKSARWGESGPPTAYEVNVVEEFGLTEVVPAGDCAYTP
jgi:hypothetical protein